MGYLQQSQEDSLLSILLDHQVDEQVEQGFQSGQICINQVQNQEAALPGERQDPFLEKLAQKHIVHKRPRRQYGRWMGRQGGQGDTGKQRRGGVETADNVDRTAVEIQTAPFRQLLTHEQGTQQHYQFEPDL